MRLHLLLVALLGGAGQAFDVVSIKPSAPETGPNFSANILRQRPDGGLTVTRMYVGNLIARAYAPITRPEIFGLPEWASRQFYDISAGSSLASATAEQRTAMLRAMLADRFQLLAHTERRELPSYDLVLDRKDGRLGPGLAPSNIDCVDLAAKRRAAEEAALKAGTAPPEPAPFEPGQPPRPCSIVGRLNEVVGEVAIPVLAEMLRGPTGRLVVDKTGLRGTYRITLRYDLANVALGAVPPPDGALSVFTAVREQLGLRLEPSRTERDVLVIDRLERPSEN